MSNAMQTRETAIVKREDAPLTIIDLLDRGMVNNASVDALERIAALYREEQSRQAKKSFDDAMAAFQAECPPIPKTKSGAQGKYKYAPLDRIIEAVKGLLQRHGFSHTCTSAVEDNRVKCTVKVTHCDGHSETAEFACPIDKRNPLLTEPQQYGGALTFAKRYAFCAAFGIMTADDDNDGSAERPKPKGPGMATEKTRAHTIQKLADIKQQALAAFIDWAWVMPDGSLDDWPLEHVPTSTNGLAELRKKIETHQ